MKHGTTHSYRRLGCRCEQCKSAAKLAQRSYRKRAYLQRGTLRTDATGTARRIQALVVIGWSMSHIARRLGIAASTVQLVTVSERVHVNTARKYAALYDELSMTIGPSACARTYARKQGWPPPLAWDDIDDPDEVPSTADAHRDDEVDDVVVARLIAGGHWRALNATRTERERAFAAIKSREDRGESAKETEHRLGLNGALSRRLKEPA